MGALRCESRRKVDGEPLLDYRTSMPPNTLPRLMARIEIQENGCWHFLGAAKNVHGHGQMSVRNFPQFAHRVSYALHNGPIPRGGHILHSCDNPPCVNPDHLRLGTNLDNVRDMDRKGRRRGPIPSYKTQKELDVA